MHLVPICFVAGIPTDGRPRVLAEADAESFDLKEKRLEDAGFDQATWYRKALPIDGAL